MEVDDKKRLQANYKAIIDNVRVKDIKDHLYESGILTQEDTEEVSLSSTTQTERTRRLLRILPRRGPKAFSAFIESLKEEYGYLVKQILETDVSLVQLANDADDVDYREKLNTLQTQLWQQTKLIVQCQTENAALRSTVEEQQKKMNEAVEQLSKTGLRRQEIVAFMQHNGDKSIEEPDSGPGGDGIQVPARVLRSHTDPVVIKEVAIEIGFDIMHFVSKRKTARPPKSQYIINMRRVVDDILCLHTGLFEQIVNGLNIDNINGYETLLRVADEIFRGQTNWGRIGVWYTFGASVGQHCGANDMHEVAQWIAEFTGIYVGQNLVDWIQKNDGWNGLNKFVTDRDRDRGVERDRESAESNSGQGSLGITMGALGLVGISFGVFAAFKSAQ